MHPSCGGTFFTLCKVARRSRVILGVMPPIGWFMNRIWIGTVVLMVVAGCTHTDTTMSTGSGKGHFDRIMKYIDVEMGGDNWRYNEAITKLRSKPPGYRRSLCIYFSDADIDNGGFSQYYQNGFGCMTISAIEGYERIGGIEMANIMKSSLYLVLYKYPVLPQVSNITDIPEGYFSRFEPVANTLEELDVLYYRAADELPGAMDVDSGYPVGAIDYYYETFTEDFISAPGGA